MYDEHMCISFCMYHNISPPIIISSLFMQCYVMMLYMASFHVPSQQHFLLMAFWFFSYTVQLHYYTVQLHSLGTQFSFTLRKPAQRKIIRVDEQEGRCRRLANLLPHAHTPNQHTLSSSSRLSLSLPFPCGSLPSS